MKLFDLGSNPIHTFLFLHREIIAVLDVVFTGYKTGENRFLQPDSTLFAPSYETLILRYGKLSFDHEVEQYIDQKRLTITSLSMYSSLTDNFVFHIEAWSSEREQLLKERDHLMTIMPSDSYVERDIKLAAYELQKLLPAFKQQKDAFLEPPSLIDFDVERAILHIGSTEKSIQLDTKPFIFLKTLMDYNGTIVGYKVLADRMQLNANQPDLTNKDIAPEVHEIKKLLRRKVKELGFDTKSITLLMQAIQPQKGVGYKFVAFPR